MKHSERVNTALNKLADKRAEEYFNTQEKARAERRKQLLEMFGFPDDLSVKSLDPVADQAEVAAAIDEVFDMVAEVYEVPDWNDSAKKRS